MLFLRKPHLFKLLLMQHHSEYSAVYALSYVEAYRHPWLNSVAVIDKGATVCLSSPSPWHHMDLNLWSVDNIRTFIITNNVSLIYCPDLAELVTEMNRMCMVTLDTYCTYTLDIGVLAWQPYSRLVIFPGYILLLPEFSWDWIQFPYDLDE